MDDRTFQSLFAAVRAACNADVWSKAVELCRSETVYGESATQEEIRIRVNEGDGLVRPTVQLWPEDADWWCDCSSSSEGCVHAAAAVIAMRQSRKAGKEMPGEDRPSARLSYRFVRTAAGLAFARYLVTDDRATRLESSLASMAAGASGVRLAVSQSDVEVELVTGVRVAGLIPPLIMPRLLDALSSCEDVQLDGKPVQTGGLCIPIHALVEDCAEGFRVRVEQNPSIDEVFANAVVRCGTKLQGVDDCALNAREIEELRVGRVVAREQVADLITELLPSLQERLPVRIVSRRVPEVVADLAPRIALETRRDGDKLVMLPTIVYGDPPIARIDGDRLTHLSGPVPLRHRQTEQRLAQQLEQVGLTPGRRAQLAAADALAVLERIRGHEVRDVDLAGDGHADFFLAPGLVPRLQVQGSSFDLSFESQDGKTVRRAEPGAVVAAWNRGESLVPLMEGGFAPLPSDWMGRFGSQIADLLAAKEASLSDELPSCMLPDLAKLCEALEQPPPAGFDKLRSLVQGFDGIAHADLPKDLQGSLRSYQTTGVDWLCFLREAGMGAMLADDMGLGKTVQALCAISGRTLVVAPTSVLHNWSDEISRFRPGLRASRYYGPNRTLEADADVVLTTYAILRLDVEILAAEPWDTVVLDEAQTIKNPESQVAQAAYRLRAKHRMTLTGTPVENRLDELWSQMHFLNRGLLGGRSDFQERYVKPIHEAAPGAARRLRDRIRPFLLRRMKAEVAPELPPRTEVVLRCQLSDSERKLYEGIRAATLPGVVEKLRSGAGVMAALEALLRLRQASCHSALVPGQQAEGSSKIELLLERLDASLAGDHKALVFSQWTSLLDLVEPHLQSAGIGYLRLDGATRDREEVVKSFQGEGGPPVLLISLKAGGTGLNLTAADHVYLLDPWWNPAVEDQAADRAHRIGQDRPVLVHRLVAENTVEEAILGLQLRKRAVADAALGDADQAGGLSRDDLLDVLGVG
ncbi:MAG: DEAD/DEAH box helicase [Deltaproteobacteria bacterium]|nr:DEAD/DEAH box helicase [Deltaproteobacteria bacterium]